MSVAQETPEIFVENMLNHVPFDGWSETAMEITAKELGLSSSEVAELFPKGLASVISIGSNDLDAKMFSEFRDRFAGQIDELSVQARIRELLLVRFEILRPHKEAVRKMIALMTKPEYANLSSRILFRTLDKIWRSAGDRSTDFNFYTKRATLAAVYSSTMLAFLDDDTPDMKKTRAFLDRRLQDVAKIPKITKPLRATAKMLGTVASQMFQKK